MRKAAEKKNPDNIAQTKRVFNGYPAREHPIHKIKFEISQHQLVVALLYKTGIAVNAKSEGER